MNWLKKLLMMLATAAKAQLLKLVDKLDNYTDEVAEIIARNTDPQKCSKVMMDYVQALLKSWLTKVQVPWYLSWVKGAVLREIDALDNLEPELAKLIEKNVKPEEVAKKVIDFVQAKLRELIEKVF